ncbi:hypothetical protein Y032_0128g1438 [Ancylostoma ceylanicum]|uniref:Protein-tyrosine phosphatase n=1 Tax=Ancylostoma ceylanicum TaxID=53326 RepID=A0A016T7X5_9BILA|nr:hypothetical protein Y032_0128g1438 [Ancylostoma ceylanicum]
MSLLTFNSKPSDPTGETTDFTNDEEAVLHGIPRGSYRPGQLVEKIRQEKDLLTSWHEKVMAAPSSFDDFLSNPGLNRFPNVLCIDRSRVKLSDQYGKGDYCHASHVDSYEKKNGYVFAQAPFSTTTEEIFWRMVIDLRPKIILILGSLQSATGPGMKCFWPEQGERTYKNSVTITLAHMEKGNESDVLGVVVSDPQREILRLPIVLFKSWKDDIITPNIPEFRKRVKAIEAIVPNKNGPTVLVCASGATRCGTYAAVDVILTRIAMEKRVGVQQTIEIILAQRYGCFQFIEHYKAIHEIAQRYRISCDFS